MLQVLPTVPTTTVRQLPASKPAFSAARYATSSVSGPVPRERLNRPQPPTLPPRRRVRGGQPTNRSRSAFALQTNQTPYAKGLLAGRNPKNPAMEPLPTDQPPAESFKGGPSSRSVPMLLPVFILFFLLLCFLSIFLLRDLLHYASAWLTGSGGADGGGDGGGGPAGGGQARGEPAGGLNPAIIASFPTLPYSAVRRVQEGKCGPECAVCLAEFAGGDLIRLLIVCCHAFHPTCIDSWLASHTTCPVCRSDLETPPDEAAVLAVREAVGGGGGGDGHAIDVVEEDGEGQSGRIRKSRSRSLSSTMDSAERGEGER